MLSRSPSSLFASVLSLLLGLATVAWSSPARAGEKRPALETVVLPVVALPGADRELPAELRAAIDVALLDRAASTKGLHVSAWRYAATTSSPARLSPSPGIEGRIDAAQAAALELDAMKAVRGLNGIIDELEGELFAAGNIESLVRANLLLASTYLDLREDSLAAGPIGRALSLRPEANLDPRRYSPTLLSAYATVRDRLGSVKRGQLVVQPGIAAQVLLDGRPVGQTPLSLDLMPGRHHLVITAPGHASVETVVEIISGATRNLGEPLVRLPAHALADALLETLALPGSRAEALELSRRLATELGVDAVLLAGAQPVAGGTILGVTLFAGTPRSILGTFREAQASLHLGAVVSDLLERLARGEGGGSAPVRQVTADASPLSVEDGTERFASSLVGYRPASKVAPTAALSTVAPGALQVEPATPPAKRRYLGLWIGSGTAVVVGAVLVALLYRPPPVEVQDPDALNLRISRP